MQNSQEYHSLSRLATRAVLRFIHDAHELCPSLFSDRVDPSDLAALFAEITIVFSAWRRLQRMRKSKEKFSEADYVANV
jgi:solute carrier family 25 carnitine/acylcarnitine transporter 20/29